MVAMARRATRRRATSPAGGGGSGGCEINPTFPVRERCSWARSTYRAFRLPPETAARRLHKGLEALQILSKAPVKPTVITYEEVTSDPSAAVCKIIGKGTGSAEAFADKIKSVMESDSQARSTISRKRTSQIPPDEGDWLQAFDEAWKRVRAPDVIDQLGPDFV